MYSHVHTQKITPPKIQKKKCRLKPKLILAYPKQTKKEKKIVENFEFQNEKEQ